MLLLCNNAFGECWENTRAADKTLGNASCFTNFSRILPTFPIVHYYTIMARDSFLNSSGEPPNGCQSTILTYTNQEAAKLEFKNAVYKFKNALTKQKEQHIYTPTNLANYIENLAWYITSQHREFFAPLSLHGYI